MNCPGCKRGELDHRFMEDDTRYYACYCCGYREIATGIYKGTKYNVATFDAEYYFGDKIAYLKRLGII